MTDVVAATVAPRHIYARILTAFAALSREPTTGRQGRP